MTQTKRIYSSEIVYLNEEGNKLSKKTAEKLYYVKKVSKSTREETIFSVKQNCYVTNIITTYTKIMWKDPQYKLF